MQIRNFDSSLWEVECKRALRFHKNYVVYVMQHINYVHMQRVKVNVLMILICRLLKNSCLMNVLIQSKWWILTHDLSMSMASVLFCLKGFVAQTTRSSQLKHTLQWISFFFNLRAFWRQQTICAFQLNQYWKIFPKVKKKTLCDSLSRL